MVGQWRMKWSTINLAAFEVGGGAHLPHPQEIVSFGLCCITSSTRCLFMAWKVVEGVLTKGHWPTLTLSILVPVEISPQVVR